jgi:hypothetical protein
LARPDDEIDRFYETVEYGEVFNDSKCLIWTGPKGGNGHSPSFGMNDEGKKRVDAVEYAYALANGDKYLRGGYEFTHKCGHDLCVNSTHILAIDFSRNRRLGKPRSPAAASA